ncbi:LOW QUALITY PROTEIN: hypothetical protein U9M48_001988 [Paspalum notatum var. saurae]|uniref:Uncharacterized protein n=1 Tax=Paspalum notatum var. saurae TaxID=547442 RepID=A0AAQ3SJE9_PASNO
MTIELLKRYMNPVIAAIHLAKKKKIHAFIRHSMARMVNMKLDATVTLYPAEPPAGRSRWAPASSAGPGPAEARGVDADEQQQRQHEVVYGSCQIQGEVPGQVRCQGAHGEAGDGAHQAGGRPGTSQRWSVTSAPLLRWRSKLKRAAQECDHTMRRCRQRLQEEEEEAAQREVRISSFPQRIAHAARSLVSSIFDRGSSDELRGPAIRRFERFAEGAGEFLRYMELGGTPRRPYIFFDALVRHLLAGEGTKRCFPFSPPEHGNGMEGVLVILLEDGYVPENNFMLSLILRLSESTDVVGVMMPAAVYSSSPELSSRDHQDEGHPATNVGLVLPPDAYVYGRIEHQDNFYTASSKWFRPNPLYNVRDKITTMRRATLMEGTAPPSEPLPCRQTCYSHPSWSNRQRAAVVVDGQTCRPTRGGLPYLKLGVQFWPHASCEDAVGASATEMINGEARGLYSNICFQELLDNILLRKAVHYLRGSAAAASYQMRWRSKHGHAYLQAEKASWRRATTRKVMGERRQKRSRPGKKVQAWTSGIDEFMSSWIAHEPAQLQALAVDWTQKQERLLLKTNPCIHDCPIMSLVP